MQDSGKLKSRNIPAIPLIYNNKTHKTVFIVSAKYYFCGMIRMNLLVLLLFFLRAGILSAQPLIKTSDLFQRDDKGRRTGELIIDQDPSLDTLISRYILANKKLYEVNNHFGMEGYRIQIYASNNRNAREESNKTRAEFMSKFPDIISYPLYAEPGYFKVRVGDFRSKIEATKLFQVISKEFPGAYIVPDVINFPDLNIK